MHLVFSKKPPSQDVTAQLSSSWVDVHPRERKCSPELQEVEGTLTFVSSTRRVCVCVCALDTFPATCILKI